MKTNQERALDYLADIHAAVATVMTLFLTPDSASDIDVPADDITQSAMMDGSEATYRYQLNDLWSMRMIFNIATGELLRAFLVNTKDGRQYPVSEDPVGG